MSISAPSQLPAEYSSRTLTITPTPTPEAGPSNPDPSNGGGPPNVRVLRLRGGPNRRQKVVWSEETVDNEGMGKKRSKICCIYHRPKAYDESSSESSSDSEGGKDPEKDERRANGGMDRREKVEGGKGEVEESSESDGGAGKGNARPPQKPRKHRHHHHSHDCGHDKHQSSANRYDHTGMASGKGKKPA